MNAAWLIDELARFGGVLTGVVEGLSPAAARWKPPDGAWSILEVCRHLLDEEVEDFRTRLRSTLEDSTRPWPPIDPPGWAIARKYNEADLADTVSRFRAERAASVDWLRSVIAGGEPDWSRSYLHPKAGPIRAGDLLVSWRAHDCLHLRQIAKRMHQLACDHAAGFSADYAGPWTA